MFSLWIAVFIIFSIGIILAYYELWIALLLLMGLIALIYLLLPRWGREIFVAIMVLFIGFAYFQCRAVDEPQGLTDLGNQEMIGVIINYPIHKQDRTGFLLRTDENSPYLKYIQVYCSFQADIKKGQQVTVQGELEVPDQPGNPGEFNYHTYLLNKRVFYIMSVDRAEDLINIIPNQGMGKLLNGYRDKIEEVVLEILPASEADLFLGMLLGEKENIEDDQYEMFQTTGIVHIFAVSGLHIGFLVLFFSFGASLLGVSKRTRFLVVMGILILYGSLIGWPISVQRAVIMASLALLAHYRGRQGGLGNSLGLAAMIIVLLDPYAIFTTSFQLSFMAAWGLVCLYPYLKDYFNYQNSLWDIVLIPLCAQLAVLPLIAYYFNIFSPCGLISNIIISYLVGGIVITGFAALLTVYFAPLAALFLYPVGFMIEILNGLAWYMSQIPGSYLWVKTPHPGLIVFYYLMVLMLLAAIYYSWPRRYFWSPTIVLGILLMIICLPASFYKYGTLEVVFLDVGQGDSILIKTPRGKFILLDGGGSYFYSVGRKKVIPYLHHRGVREIYMLINSHPDCDHLQGLIEAASQIPFRYAVVPETLVDVPEYEPLEKMAQARGVPVLTATAGQCINIEEGLKLEVLYPQPGINSYDYNNQSLVLRCEFGQYSLLLPGDLEKTGLQHIIEKDSWKPTLVVKVPHHGSGGSLLEEFYSILNPYAAVISVGKNNIYGHPSQEVLDCLEKQGILVLRTDQHGAIAFESDGQQMKINLFRP